MGNLRQLVLTCALSAAVGLVGACRQTPKHAADQSGALRREALGLSDQLTAIYKRGDWTALAKLVDPDYLGTTQDGQADTAVLEREFPKIRLLDYKRESATVKQLRTDVVLVNESGVLSETYDGQDISGRYRMTTIWVKRDGRWRLLFEQELPLAASP